MVVLIVNNITVLVLPPGIARLHLGPCTANLDDPIASHRQQHIVGVK